jgi:4-diphosphocytidyl-2-C-methyl-D-erythritol kinase
MRALIRELAPAKINLFLHVGARRDDGYHPLQSLAVFTGGETAADVLSLAPADAVSLSLDGPFAVGLEGESDNLVLRAARLLAARTSGVGGAAITLTKNLPVASGIGGGSSDAAAAFRGLSALWHISLDDLTLREMAASLGSDIPACIAAIPAFMEGRGENLTPVAAMPRLSLLLVNPGVPVPTRDVFAALKTRRGTDMTLPQGAFRDTADLLRFLETTGNDLEEPARAIQPVIGQVLAAIAARPGALFTRMSGSGATCFGIFADDDCCARAGMELRSAHSGWWTAATFVPERGIVTEPAGQDIGPTPEGL